MGKNGTRMNSHSRCTLGFGQDERGLVEEVKRKKEFSGLPDSVVERALKESGDEVKEARKLLRKYFGVFLTNKVLRFARSQVAGRPQVGMTLVSPRSQDILSYHMSSKKRDYQKFYSRIFESIGFHKKSHGLRPRISYGSKDENVEGCGVGSVVDLGCGVNGFSYGFLPKGVNYIGVEAAGQLVEQMNVYFEDEGFDARAVRGDLFDVDMVVKILRKAKKDRVVFMFQVIDALESVERNFSLKLISRIMENCEWLVLTVPLVSLGGGKKFAVKRKWLTDFLERGFDVVGDFEMFGERIICVRKR